MNRYRLRFSLFNRHIYRCTVKAESEEHAKQIVRNKIEFLQVNRLEEDVFDHFKRIFKWQ